MWWVEWIYQMLIPVGQSLVLGLSVAITGGHIKGVLTLTDIFVALAGGIGLLGSAVYVKRLVDAVASGFGAKGMGHSSGEGVGHALAMGSAFALADELGQGAFRAGSAPVKSLGRNTVGRTVKGLDRFVGGKALGSAISAAPETHADAILGGAALDDMMSHYTASGMPTLQDKVGGTQTGGLHGPMAAGGGVVGVAEAAGSSGGGGGGRGGSGGGRSAHPLLQSKTGRAMAAPVQNMGRAIKGSYTAQALRVRRAQWKNQGGIFPTLGDKVSPHNNKAKRIAHRQALNDLREHLRGQMDDNALQSRAHIASTNFDDKGQWIDGTKRSTPAIERYTSERQNLLGAVSSAIPGVNVNTDTMEDLWRKGATAESGVRKASGYEGEMPVEVIKQAHQTYAAFRAADLDHQTYDALDERRIRLPEPMTPEVKRRKQGHTLMDDLHARGRYQRWNRHTHPPTKKGP